MQQTKMKSIWRLASLMLGLLALLIVGSAAAQTSYPEKLIRMVVGFPPGSQPDIVARLIGQKFVEAWGKPVVIDNITGAAGNIATERVAKAVSDGYTLGFLGQGTLVVNPSLYKLAYDPVKDFAPVSQVTVSLYMLVVHNAVPANSVKELVALAKAQPGALTFASGGSGGAPHMAVADIDDGTVLDDLKPAIIGFSWVAYSTHSHAADHPKFRIVFPLRRSCTPTEWPGVWNAFTELLSGHCDLACKDVSLLFLSLFAFTPLFCRHHAARPNGITCAPALSASSMSAYCCIISRRSGKYSAWL